SRALKVQQPSAREEPPMTSPLSPRPISALRARMIEDMTVRGFTEETHNNYIREVRAFAAFIRRPPDTATAEDLRRFQLHQTQSGMQPPSINGAVSALRFFTVTLDQPDLGRRLTVLPYPRRIPAVLSVGEVTLLLRAVSASEVTRQCSPPPTAPGCTSWKLSRSSPVVSTERADAILP
ncbi:site-specific integrase, partial [Bradyrhizobium sp.]|uniref:site-specific integrase n=1 Tax=Bradyrhizobium sp. TaxID=376 RepID=UPI003BAE5703